MTLKVRYFNVDLEVPMDLNWLMQLLPIINGAGIPILAVGIVLLLRAYQAATKSYQETSEHLKIENERLRGRLIEAEDRYFLSAEKIKDLMSKSIEAVGQLEARKVALLSTAEGISKDDLKAEIDKLNKAIEVMHHINLFKSERQFEDHRRYVALMANISELIGQISDIKSRIALLGVVTSKEEQQEIGKELSDYKRGLVFENVESRYLRSFDSETDLSKLRLKGEIEKMDKSENLKAHEANREPSGSPHSNEN
jgi:hypothetical protein